MKIINACLDQAGSVRCATEYDEWCDTCPNKDSRLKWRMDMIVLKNHEDLVKYFRCCTDKHIPVALFITIPDCPKPELIINQRENFDYKLDYYLTTYNDNLEHRYAKGIKIVGATALTERW